MRRPVVVDRGQVIIAHDEKTAKKFHGLVCICWGYFFLFCVLKHIQSFISVVSYLQQQTIRKKLKKTSKILVVRARGGVEDTRLEAKAKDTKKIRGQSQVQTDLFPRTDLSRPRTGMLEAKAKDQGHSRKCFQKKRSSKSFSGNLQFMGAARIFDWGGLNHKSHAMTSSKICLFFT